MLYFSEFFSVFKLCKWQNFYPSRSKKMLNIQIWKKPSIMVTTREEGLNILFGTFFSSVLNASPPFQNSQLCWHEMFKKHTSTQRREQVRPQFLCKQCEMSSAMEKIGKIPAGPLSRGSKVLLLLSSMNVCKTRSCTSNHSLSFVKIFKAYCSVNYLLKQTSLPLYSSFIAI